MRILRTIRDRATRAIKRKIQPLLHGSGFYNGTRKGLPLVVLKRTRKIRYPITFAIDDGIDGFTDYGVITDAFAGGLETLGYEQIAVEDLVKLERLVSKLTPDHFR